MAESISEKQGLDINAKASLLNTGYWWALIFVPLWYACNGYSIGIWDHAVLIPIAEAALGETSLQGDYLFTTNHPTFVWFAYGPLRWLLGLELGYAILHGLALLAFAVSLIYLCRVIGGRTQSPALLAIVLALCLPATNTFADIPLFDNLLLPRVTVFPLQIWALAEGIRGRWLRAFTLAGLGFNFHPTTSSHCAFLLGFCWLFSGKLKLARLIEPLVYFLAGSPLLIHMLLQGSVSQVPTPFPAEWASAVATQWPFHHFPVYFKTSQWLFGALPFILWLLARPYFKDKAIDRYMLGILVFCLLGWVSIEILHLPQVIALHVFEITRLGQPLAYVVFAGGWLNAWHSHSSRQHRTLLTSLLVFCLVGLMLQTNVAGEQLTVLVAAIQLACIVFIAALCWLFKRFAKPSHVSAPALRPRILLPGLALLFLSWRLSYANISIMPWHGYHWQIRDSHINLFAREAFIWDKRNKIPIEVRAGYPMLQWIRKNLTSEALIVTNPLGGGVMDGLRVVAQRKPLVLWRDGSECAFNFAFCKHWQQRIAALAGPDTINTLSDKGSAFQAWLKAGVMPTQEGYQQGDTARFKALHTQYGATHLVRNTQLPPLPLPLLYKDAAFHIYSLMPTN